MGFPTKYVNWKGKTFYQIVSSIQKNTKNAPTISVARLRHALPLTIYRREIGIKAPTVCSRASMKIFDFETPGNNIVSETQKPSYNNNGLLGNVEDMTPTTLSAENGSCNTQTSCFLSPQNNARKRCRSSGMIPKKFNINKNNDTYATSTQQYLTSRNMTIKQNEYNYIRKGSSGIDPGPGAASNIYSPGGLSHCYQPQVSVTNNNNVFYYVWADGQTYTVTIPNGLYNVESLNQYFQTAQIQNKTYFVGAGLSKNFLMNISYNTSTNSVILYAGVISQGSCTSNGYTEPSGATWTIAGFPLTDPTPTGAGVSGATYFQIPLNTNFSNLVGFVPGIYFAGINNSAFAGDITPKYVALYYKPNNSGFGVQGAVDASTRLQRLKYNTITTAAGSLRSPYGDAAANALAYGVSEQGYTIKTQVGDKVIYTPVINKQTGQLCRKRIIYR
jgi:hypothetical protein